VVRVIVAVRGLTSRNVEFCNPPESLTVRCILKKTFADVSPVVGTTNEPLVIPLVGERKG
jgi:hypothetical protein